MAWWCAMVRARRNLEGSALTKFITVLNEYLGFLDKLNKRIREERAKKPWFTASIPGSK